jgi:hypothetical protein
VFINANERFLDTLRPNFPNLHTVQDLIGKTDFDFYSSDLATAYRADDQRSISGGVEVQVVERYEPVGASATFVLTTKTPLRDTNGQIYALRIMFYNIPEPGQTTLPVFNTEWLRNYAISIDKDTNSIFLNANETFLATLRPSFPNILTVTNLIGRDDYYFYAPDLAEKFRADDHKVMVSGVDYSAIEDNQPLGGIRTSFQVTKKPLRRPDGTVYGIRILAWEIPQIDARLTSDSIEVKYPKTASEFILQRTVNLSSPTVWETVTVSATANDPISVVLPRTGGQSYFRLFLPETFVGP